MNPESSIIEFRHFTVSIAGHRILDRISFAVQPGEHLAVIGPNGAGKTTLLKSLVRIVTGGTGQITLAGRSLDAYRQRELARLIGYVPQNDGRDLPFIVRDFTLMGRYPRLSPFTPITREDRAAVTEALEAAGALAFRDRHISSLSGGERQKVLIAAALAQGPRILLLDEPTTFLDPKHETEITRRIVQLNRERGLTIVSVTHDLNRASLSADRVLALKEGRVVFLGRPPEVMKDEVLEAIFGKHFLFVAHPQTGAAVTVPEKL
jgi:iron complex transport system ATP-binding protein